MSLSYNYHGGQFFGQQALFQHICARGVARRRPRGPGLNLKMQKKKKNKSEIPDPCLHEIQCCHIKQLSLLLAAIKSPDTTYIIFYIFVSTHSYMIFCQQLTEWSFITIISDVSTILWLIILELWSLFWMKILEFIFPLIPWIIW